MLYTCWAQPRCLVEKSSGNCIYTRHLFIVCSEYLRASTCPNLIPSIR